ncbi:protein of unknown function DUF167 [Desulfofarcimen acetoxidans DSM 771]|jgi:uncharacterized protein (TIGR00251 family)|uniref:UPF0235 protein Dtox_1088 n=1 Tax=Desulfofarcimen acetoxidans (strain ATCC 49208 / DSM 771 / KCTC 5769 / VKM B-1644 / 5575) TaxID=485916 RepID=C8W4A6_DESAS|nr:DUF167 domain-containing protein [Desulfofarcimen acetoxidans]ACV61974.1 protein of unknown function DUF167 [Desulfofarcimen acetoxidans DSM 771]
MLDIRSVQNGVVFKVRVQPRASKDQVAGLWEDAVKIRLTAPPVEGEANRALCDFLAKHLGVTRAQVDLVTGQTGRNKLVRVSGITAESVLQRLGLYKN